MGYLTSLMRQTGLGRPAPPRRSSQAIDLEVSRVAEAVPEGPPSTSLRRQASSEHADRTPPPAGTPFAPLARTDAPISQPPPPLRPPYTEEDSPPTIRVGERRGAEPDPPVAVRVEERRVTFEKVRAWVAAGTEEDARSAPAISPVPAPAQREAPEYGRVVEADSYALEIGSIEIVMESPRLPEAVRATGPRRQPTPPDPSWTLASRHYLR